MKDDSEDMNDVVGVTIADRGDIWLNTDVLRTHILGDYSTGVRVHRWADKVCLVAGTDDDDTRVTVGQNLSPEKAREVADNLMEAADHVEDEQRKVDEYDEEDEQSFLRRLIS